LIVFGENETPLVAIDYYDTYGLGDYNKPVGELALENGFDHVLDQLEQYRRPTGRSPRKITVKTALRVPPEFSP
jgi:hypothetical protein